MAAATCVPIPTVSNCLLCVGNNHKQPPQNAIVMCRNSDPDRLHDTDNSYGFSSCGVGSYYVLEQTFPTSDDPKLVNTTSATPLPKDAVPPPAEAGYKG